MLKGEVAMQKKILIVEDDPKIKAYLISLFEDNGYAVCSAGDVGEALDVARSERPSLITLDLDLPGEWGPRFYRRMSQDKDLKNTPVIVISGMPGNEYAVGKAVASLSKPFDRQHLLNIVKETIG
jgi:DNA-binding response OmpR family regulator